MITIALTKGRIMQETLPLLQAAGITPAEDIASSRKLRFATNQKDVRLLVLRGADVITYIRRGIADIGVVGKDMLLEDGGDGLYELVDLNIACCKLMTAGIAGTSSAVSPARLRVATKYTNLARVWYAKKGIQIDVIKLYGGMELAPLMGLADEIVDIVDSGKTLLANGLESREFIADISSRLVSNKASMKVKHAQLMPIVDALSGAVK
ncbi:MAG: ATP phosphoribosyltransferase [Pseudomonadales bacterium]|nr:ATP phosphoribosyltransferase [Pseudomonadales bacterium]MDG2079912.1 ATP phosphoribosyltransferase [Pseudomonadales bacterium]